MRRILSLVVVGVLLVSIAPMGMGVAIAQDGANESTGDQDELEADAIEGGNESDAIESAAIVQSRNQTVQFGAYAELIGWGFDDGTFQMVVTTERPLDLVVSDGLAGVGQEGAVQVPTHEASLQDGTHVVTMPVETFRGGHSVGVGSDTAQVRLSSEMTAPAEDEPDDPLQYFGGMSGLFWGIGMTIGLSGCAAAYVV